MMMNGFVCDEIEIKSTRKAIDLGQQLDVTGKGTKRKYETRTAYCLASSNWRPLPHDIDMACNMLLLLLGLLVLLLLLKLLFIDCCWYG